MQIKAFKYYHDVIKNMRINYMYIIFLRKERKSFSDLINFTSKKYPLSNNRFLLILFALHKKHLYNLHKVA